MESGQLYLFCPCGCAPVEIGAAALCRRCYHRRYHSERYFDGRRHAILRRDRGSCRICGTRQGLVVHHRAPGRNHPRFLISLCIRCHTRVHRCASLRAWVPPMMHALWSELHPGPLQLQFPLAGAGK